MKYLLLIPALFILTGCSSRGPSVQQQVYLEREAAAERDAYAERLQQHLLDTWRVRLALAQENTKRDAILFATSQSAPQRAEPARAYRYLENLLETCQESVKDCEECGPTEVDTCGEIASELNDLKRRAGVTPAPSSTGTTITLIGSTVTGSSLLSTAATVTNGKMVPKPPVYIRRPVRQNPLPETTGQTIARGFFGLANNIVYTGAGVLTSPTGVLSAAGYMMRPTLQRPTFENNGKYTQGDDNADRYDHNTKITEYAGEE